MRLQLLFVSTTISATNTSAITTTTNSLLALLNATLHPIVSCVDVYGEVLGQQNRDTEPPSLRLGILCQCLPIVSSPTSVLHSERLPMVSRERDTTEIAVQRNYVRLE